MSLTSGSDDTSKPGFVSAIILKFNTLTVGKSETSHDDRLRISSPAKNNSNKPSFPTKNSSNSVSFKTVTEIFAKPDDVSSHHDAENAKFEVVGEVSVKDRIKAYASLSNTVNLVSKFRGNTSRENIQSTKPNFQRFSERKVSTQEVNKTPAVSTQPKVTETISQPKIDTQPRIEKKKSIEDYPSFNIHPSTHEKPRPHTRVSVASIREMFSSQPTTTETKTQPPVLSNKKPFRTSATAKIVTEEKKVEEKKVEEKKVEEKKVEEKKVEEKPIDQKNEIIAPQEEILPVEQKSDDLQLTSEIKEDPTLLQHSSVVDDSLVALEYNLESAEKELENQQLLEPKDKVPDESAVHQIREVQTNETMNLKVDDALDRKAKRLDSLSSVSSTGDLVAEFTSKDNNVFDPSEDPDYYPLPSSYKSRVDDEGNLEIKLPETKFKSCLKSEDKTKGSRKRVVNINAAPTGLMETYAITEYERGDDSIDPLTASAEYEIEKKTESLEKFELQIQKDEKGLGLSIVGIGLGSDMGAEKLGIYIKALTPGGAAEKTGKLMVHDQLLEVDGTSLVGVTQAFAAQTLKATSKIVKEKSPASVPL